VFHAFVASPWGRPRYYTELRNGQNRFRWIEYTMSSGLMILMISMVFGITDVAGLLGIVGVNVAMILFGWVMEIVNEPGDQVWWGPFWFGCIAGIVPWIGLFIYLLGPETRCPASCTASS
jgi:4-hydroxybenzoate polyprenyltransferase